MAFVEARNLAVHFARGSALLQILPLVVRFLSLADTELDFHARILPVHAQGDERVPLDLRQSEEPMDLLFVQEQAPKALRLVLRVAGARVRLNVEIDDKGLSLFDARESVVEVREAAPDRLDLRALQLDARLHALEDVKIPKRLAID